MILIILFFFGSTCTINLYNNIVIIIYTNIFFNNNNFSTGCVSGRTCTLCYKWFTSNITLSKHRMWHHKETFGTFKYNCDSCPYSTNTTTNFKKHSAVHNIDRPFMCPRCGNRFYTVGSLSVHEIIHTGENQFYS